MKKNLSILLAFLLTFTNFILGNNIAFADISPPNISAKYAVLMDYESGDVLYSKNKDVKMYPASTTKIWTAYVAIKYAKDLNELIDVGNFAPVEGSSMYIKPYEKFTVLELLQGLMIVSGNDASIVLANHIAGSTEAFVDLMNKEASLVGATNTHFNNTSGLPDDNHFTTAFDMALMSRKAMSNPTFREIVKTKKIDLPANENREIDRILINSNKFLTGNYQIPYKNSMVDVRYDIVDGLKTGFTDAAGKCLVSSARKDNMRLISAVFKTYGDNMFIDSRTLLDYGFDNYKSYQVINKEDYSGSKNIWYSKERKLKYTPAYNYHTTLNNNENLSTYTAKPKLNDIELPIKQGDVVGKLEIYKDKESKPTATVKLIAENDVNNIFTIIINNPIFKILRNIVLLLILLILLFILFVLIKKKRRRMNRLNRNKNIYSNKRRRR